MMPKRSEGRLAIFKKHSARARRLDISECMRGVGLASRGKLEKSNQSTTFRNVDGEAIFAGGRCQNCDCWSRGLFR